MNIEDQLQDLSKAIDNKQSSVTQQEMLSILNIADNKKDDEEYRSVSEAPIIVDIMSISDPAAKKLANLMNPDDVPDIIDTDKSNDESTESSSYIGKIFEFVKGSFIGVVRMIGSAIGWVTGSVITALKQVSGWVLNKIEEAMMRAVAMSAGNMVGRFKLLGMVLKGAAIGSITLGAYNLYAGVEKLDSGLDEWGSRASEMFSSPENIVQSTGNISEPLAFSGSSTTTGSSSIEPSSDSESSEESSPESSEELDEPNPVIPVDEPVTPEPLEISEDIIKPVSPVDDLQTQSEPTIDKSIQSEPLIPQDPPQTTSKPDIEYDEPWFPAEEKEISQFLELNHMFEPNSDKTIDKMNKILVESQSEIPGLIPDSSQSSVNKSLESPANSSGGSTLKPSSTSQSSTQPRLPTGSTGDQSTGTVDNASIGIDKVFNDAETTGVSLIESIQKASDTTSGSKSSSGSISNNLNFNSSPTSSNSITSSLSPDKTSKPSDILSNSPKGTTSISKDIERSDPHIKSIVTLTNSTSNLQQLELSLKGKVESLQRDISSKNAPTIVNNSTKTSESTVDYVCDIDSVRSLTRNIN